MEKQQTPSNTTNPTDIEEDALTRLSMGILIHSGNARDFTIKGLEKMETSEFDEAGRLFKKAREETTTAHSLQTDTLQQEAQGTAIRYSPLFSHAQDTMMTAQSELLIAEHLNRILAKLDQPK